MGFFPSSFFTYFLCEIFNLFVPFLIQNHICWVDMSKNENQIAMNSIVTENSRIFIFFICNCQCFWNSSSKQDKSLQTSQNNSQRPQIYCYLYCWHCVKSSSVPCFISFSFYFTGLLISTHLSLVPFQTTHRLLEYLRTFFHLSLCNSQAGIMPFFPLPSRAKGGYIHRTVSRRQAPCSLAQRFDRILP